MTLEMFSDLVSVTAKINKLQRNLRISSSVPFLPRANRQSHLEITKQTFQRSQRTTEILPLKVGNRATLNLAETLQILKTIKI